MYLLNPTSDGAYTTPDAMYRVERNPDPWERPEGKRPDTWLVQRATYNPAVYSTIREVRTLNDARAYIDDDMRGDVFQPDKLENTGRTACRWCDTFEEDVRFFTARSIDIGCRLCRSEVTLLTLEASHV